MAQRLDGEPAPRVSVVVCAYTLERRVDLKAAVASLTSQSPPPHEIIVVVDHNPDLLRWAESELGALVLPNRRTRGLSGARNTGILAATGDVVAFLDDDAAAEPGWLSCLMAHFQDETVLAVGGVAHPRWPAGRPPLYPAAPGADHGELDWVVGCTYRGQPVSVSEVRNVMGCTMAFRAGAARRVGGFREDLGRTARRPLGCEETELCIRLKDAHPEGRVIHDPSFVVHHRVGAPRLHWRYLVTRCFAEGESKSAVARLVGRRKALSTERSYAARILPSALWRELRVAARGRPDGVVGAAAIVVAPLVAAGGYVTDRARTPPRRVVGRRSSPPTAPRLVDEPHPATES